MNCLPSNLELSALSFILFAMLKDGPTFLWMTPQLLVSNPRAISQYCQVGKPDPLAFFLIKFLKKVNYHFIYVHIYCKILNLHCTKHLCSSKG
jgi:hypothetical protein